MDSEQIRKIAEGAAESANKIVNASEALQLMKRCTDENLGSVTVSQQQCEAVIWMLQVLKDGPSDG